MFANATEYHDGFCFGTQASKPPRQDGSVEGPGVASTADSRQTGHTVVAVAVRGLAPPAWKWVQPMVNVMASRHRKIPAPSRPRLRPWIHPNNQCPHSVQFSSLVSVSGRFPCFFYAMSLLPSLYPLFNVSSIVRNTDI